MNASERYTSVCRIPRSPCYEILHILRFAESRGCSLLFHVGQPRYLPTCAVESYIRKRMLILWEFAISTISSSTTARCCLHTSQYCAIKSADRCERTRCVSRLSMNDASSSDTMWRAHYKLCEDENVLVARTRSRDSERDERRHSSSLKSPLKNARKSWRRERAKSRIKASVYLKKVFHFV